MSSRNTELLLTTASLRTAVLLEYSIQGHILKCIYFLSCTVHQSDYVHVFSFILDFVCLYQWNGFDYMFMFICSCFHYILLFSKCCLLTYCTFMIHDPKKHEFSSQDHCTHFFLALSFPFLILISTLYTCILKQQ